MPKCSFCKQQYEFPKGTTVVQKDGTPRHYCCSKCRKNAERRQHLKKRRRVKWVDKHPTQKSEKDKK